MMENTKKRVQISLRDVITIPFVVLVVLAVGLTGYFSYSNMQKGINRTVAQLQVEIASQIQQHIDVFLRTPHQINQINKNAIEQGLLDINSPEILERYFWSQIQVFEDVTSIYFGYPQGGLVDAGREGADGPLYVIRTDGRDSGTFNKYATDEIGNRTELLTSIPDFDASTRPWFLRAAENGVATWGEIYLLFTGQDLALSASQPVYNLESGELLGVVSTDIFVSHLRDYLSQLEMGISGLAFVIERDGALVTSSTDELPLSAAREGDNLRRLSAVESSIPRIRLAAEFLHDQYKEYDAISAPQTLEFEMANQRQYLHVFPINDEFGIDWLCVVVIPESDFTAQININTRETAALIGVATIFVIVGGIFLAGNISASVRNLTRSAQALARGEKTDSVQLSRIREMGILADSYNQMANQISESISVLKAEVENRKEIESSLRESERRFQEMLENVEMIAVMLDFDGKITFCNEYMQNLTGWACDEVVGMSWFENFIPPEIRHSLHNEVFLKAFRKGEMTPHYVNEILTRSGDRRLISWNNTIFRDFEGQIIGITSLGEDITERVATQEEIRRRNLEMEVLVDISHRLLGFRAKKELLAFIVAEIVRVLPGAESASLWEFDEEKNKMIPLVWEGHIDGEISGLELDPNSSLVGLVYRTRQSQLISNTKQEEAFEFLGLKELDSIRSVIGVPLMVQDHFIGGLFADNYSNTHAFTKSDLRLVESITFQASLALENARLFRQITGHADSLEKRINERTDELRLRVAEVEQLNSGMVNIMEDIQRANQQVSAAATRLSIANEELEAFAYSVSHDLRAPLRGIRGFAEILQERHKADLNQQGQEYIDYVVQASDHMAELIEDLLEYSRLGRRPSQRIAINLELIIEEVMANLTESIRETEAEIILPETFPVVIGDRVPLLQVFLNLFDNALKYHRPNLPPKIELGWQEDSEYAMIAVSDNGVGIPEENRADIFTLFQRLHSEEEVPGTGIGLALVRKAVLLMEGEITVDSAKGGGTTFKIKLPLEGSDLG